MRHKSLEYDELLANALKLDEEYQHIMQVNTSFILSAVLLLTIKHTQCYSELQTKWQISIGQRVVRIARLWIMNSIADKYICIL